MKNLKICILGSSGMVGRALLPLTNTQKRYTVLSPSSRELDLTRQTHVQQYFEHHKPDTVILLAAKVGGIKANISHPTAFYLQNALISTHVIASALSQKIPNLINIGSSCMYPRDRAELFETDLLCGQLEPTNEGYALAKIGAASFCRYIHQEYGYQYKTLIPCNLYGPHDNFDIESSHMIPATIHKIANAMKQRKDTIEIWGDGTARREFLYVEDLANCICKAIDELETLPPLMNVGIGHDYTINEYYQAIADCIGYKGSFTHNLSQPVGTKKKLLNTNLATSWGWQYKTSLREGLLKTYNFFNLFTKVST